jgi:hypothetical protein
VDNELRFYWLESEATRTRSYTQVKVGRVSCKDSISRRASEGTFSRIQQIETEEIIPNNIVRKTTPP